MLQVIHIAIAQQTESDIIRNTVGICVPEARFAELTAKDKELFQLEGLTL